MSVRPAKKRGAWEVRVYAGNDPITGRKRELSRTVTGNKRDALKVERELKREVDAGRHASTDGTVTYLLEEWFKHAHGRWSPKWADRVRFIIDSRFVPKIGTVKLSKLSPIDLDRLYHVWLSDGLEPRTIGQYHAVIRRALNQAVKWGWVTANVARMATPPSVRSHPINPPSAAQTRAILAAMAQDPLLRSFAVFVRLAAATGARRGELCALRAFDLDMTGVTIARSISQVGKVTAVKDTKTHQIRRISVDPDTMAMILGHMLQAQNEARVGGQELVPNPYLFSLELDHSEHWKPDSMTQKWRHVSRKYGLDGVRLHDLRHQTATSLLTMGVDVRTVAGRLGHAKPATTLNVYSAWVPARDEDAAGMLGDMLRPPELPRTTEETEE